ncbi:FAT domain-containing protein [Ordospora colligata OC4]|uniref:FAT domain-containing protein n=1 Tax=Ordospora colligata OC4 TaxID=1354746 RepID=A0A0B2UNK9_9MICR|nr:FAT domain-containing protein [Ordospora colligata OC4]KHN70545.1 FAT domain-containing protein [Ordospora colligata OC4]TBU17545.1 FAT domain-containing protein [Ordospora colligata]
MMNELFLGNESNDMKIQKLKKYVESEAFLDACFFPHNFLEGLAVFAIGVLRNTEPEKKAPFTSGGNEARYTVLRILSKFVLGKTHGAELVQLLHVTLKSDNLPNMILAMKLLSSLSRSGVISGELGDIHAGVVFGVMHDLFGNIDTGDEGLIEMSLFAIGEMFDHSYVFFMGVGRCEVKLEQFLARAYRHVRIAIDNRQFMDLAAHRRVFCVEMCSMICGLLKLTCENASVLMRMGTYQMLVMDIALVGMAYCPPECLEMRREICYCFGKVCAGSKDAFLFAIEKVDMFSFLFSPDMLGSGMSGLRVFFELFGLFRDVLSKSMSLDFVVHISEVVVTVCCSVEKICNEIEDGQLSEGIEGNEWKLRVHIELMKMCLREMDTALKHFVARSVDAEDMSPIYARSFYDLDTIFTSVCRIVGVISKECKEANENKENEIKQGNTDGADRSCARIHSQGVYKENKESLKEMMFLFVCCFKEVMGRIRMADKIGSIDRFSTTEIHVLRKMFERSFDVFLCEVGWSEYVVGEFYSVLSMLWENVAMDISECFCERSFELWIRSERFIGVWKAVCKNAVLGNPVVSYGLRWILTEIGKGRVEEVKWTVRHLVLFFSNNSKKIKRTNVFLMHRTISVLMTKDVRNIKCFEVLFEIFEAFRGMPESSAFFQKYIFDNFLRIVEHLMRLYDSQKKEIFVRLIFALPVSVNLVEADIHVLVRPIEKGMCLDMGTRIRALSILMYVLDFSKHDKIAGLEDVWKKIIKGVYEGLRDSRTSLLCSKILGKLKSYHKMLVDHGEWNVKNMNSKVMQMMVGGDISVCSVFFEAVEKLRGGYECREMEFRSEGTIVRFRKVCGKDIGDEERRIAFKFVTKMLCGMIGIETVKRKKVACDLREIVNEINNSEVVVLDVLEYVYMGKVEKDVRLADIWIDMQCIYDGILGLFSCYETCYEEDAQELLHSIYGLGFINKMIVFYKGRDERMDMLPECEVLLDALAESFRDIDSKMPFRMFLTMIQQGYEAIGKKSEGFWSEFYGSMFLKFEGLCKLSDERSKEAGMNGMLCLAAVMPPREMVRLRMCVKMFSNVYGYFIPPVGEDYELPLKLVIFILRYKYGMMRRCARLEGISDDLESELGVFVEGLYDTNKRVVEFSKRVLLEAMKNEASGILSRHKGIIFKFLKNEYVILNRTMMIRHLEVFVFCVTNGGDMFDESEMRYLIGKFIDNAMHNEELKEIEGAHNGYEDVGKEMFKGCECERSRGDDEVVDIGGIFKNLSELSARDCIEMCMEGLPEVKCSRCMKEIYLNGEARQHQFANEGNELMYWMKEFYMIVIKYSKNVEEIRNGMDHVMRHASEDITDCIRRMYIQRPIDVRKILFEQVEIMMNERQDYKAVILLAGMHNVFEMPEDSRVTMMVMKALNEMRTAKEFLAMMHDERNSMFFKALELGLLLKGQEQVYSEILETYVALDGYGKDYAKKAYAKILSSIGKIGTQFIGCMIRRIHESAVYELCVNLCNESDDFSGMMSEMKNMIAERISQAYFRMEGVRLFDGKVFLNAYKLLCLIGYEMRTIDVQVILGMYSEMRSRAKGGYEIRRLIGRCISFFSVEDFEMLFKDDPWFVMIEGIDPECFSSKLSLQTLKCMLRSVDKKDKEKIQRLVECFGDNKHMLIELFVGMGIKSEELLRYARENIQNVNLRGVLLYYLCTFETGSMYFEMSFKMPYQDRRYTIYCLERLVDTTDVSVFEEIMLVVLRSEVRSKTSGWILFPLMMSRPKLISKRIGIELIGMICKLIKSNVRSQVRIGFRLFRVLYDRYCKWNETMEEGYCEEGMMNVYTMMFAAYVSSEKESVDEMIVGCKLKLNLELLNLVPEKVNTERMLKAVEEEMQGDKCEEYKMEVIKAMLEVVPLSVWMIGEVMIGTMQRIVKGKMIDYKEICVHIENDEIKYTGMSLYNLMSILCDIMDAEMSEDVEGDLMSCLLILKFLIAEYNKNKSAKYFEWIENGIERITYELSETEGMESVICEMCSMFMEALRNEILGVEMVSNKVCIMMPDLRISLSRKMEILDQLSAKGCDEDVLGMLTLSAVNKYKYSGVCIGNEAHEFFMKGLCSRSKELRRGCIDLLDVIVPRNESLRVRWLLNVDWKECRMVEYVFLVMMMYSHDDVRITVKKSRGYGIGDRSVWKKECVEEEPNMCIESIENVLQNAIEGIDVYSDGMSVNEIVDLFYIMQDSVREVLPEILKRAIYRIERADYGEVFEEFSGFVEQMASMPEVIQSFMQGFECILRYAKDECKDGFDRMIEKFSGGDGWYGMLEYADEKQRMKIYERLLDEDGMFGIWRSMCIFPETMQASFLQQIGKVRDAQMKYEEVQKKANDRKISFEKEEYGEWQKRWVECAKELQQWDVCYEYGVHIKNYELEKECLWHMCDFRNQGALGKFSELECVGPRFEQRFYEAFGEFFVNSSLEKIRGCISDGIKELRRYPTCSGIGFKLQMYLQIMIEMIEFEPMLISKADGETLASVLFRWKDKEPCALDGIGIWGMFKTWRVHAYSKLGIVDRIQMDNNTGTRGYGDLQMNGRVHVGMAHTGAKSSGNENGMKIRREIAIRAGNEMAKVLNAFSKAAIAHEYNDVALFQLKEVFDLSSIKVCDAFEKVMHELMCFLSKCEYKTGFDQCNLTNIQYFNDMQCSTLVGMKGMFCEKMGKFSEAEKYYLQSVQVCNALGESWLAWGKFLMSRAEKEERVEYEESFLAILQGVIYSDGKNACKGILKLLRILKKDGSVCEEGLLEKILYEADMSRFVYFVPQFIELLDKKDVSVAEMVLVKIAQEYSQAVVRPLKLCRERLRMRMYPRKSENEFMMHMNKLKMKPASGNERYDAAEKKHYNVFLENVMRVYNQVKNRRYGRELWKMQCYIYESFNSCRFKEEDLVYEDIEKILKNAVQHVIGRKALSAIDQVGVLNEMISHVSLCGVGKELKDEVISCVFRMKSLCPLEEISDLVKFRSKLKRAVEESFCKNDRFGEAGINMMLHRSVHEHRMFEQYCEIRSNYKRMVNIEMFEPRWSYLHRKRIGRNRIHVRGSDGRIYRYEIRKMKGRNGGELVVPQMSLMVNEIMGEHVRLRRKEAELKLFVPVIMCEDLVVECFKEPVHEMSDVYERMLNKYGMSVDECVLLYLNHFASLYEIDEEEMDVIGRKYDLKSRMLKRATRDITSKGKGTTCECPNVKKDRCIQHEEVDASIENDVKAVICAQRERYALNIALKKTSCLGCGEEGIEIEPCTYRYDVTKHQKQEAYEKMYNTFRDDSSIEEYFKNECKSYGRYFWMKDRMLVSYSMNTAFLYLLSIIDRDVKKLVVTKESGCFMNRMVCNEIHDVLSKRRMEDGVISPGYQKFFRKEGIEGTFLSVIYHFAEVLNEGDWYEDALKVFGSRMIEDCAEEMVEKICREGMEKVRHVVGKSEDGTYNVIPMVSKWMDILNVGQVDPRWIAWL